MRIFMAHLPAKQKKTFGAKLKQIWLQPDYDSAKMYAYTFMDDYENKYPEAIKTLEDSLQFFNFDKIDSRKIASTNMIERLNRENRRRTQVVGIFPSLDSYIRLVTSYLIEYSEDWSTGRCYIDSKVINLIYEEYLKLHKPHGVLMVFAHNI